MLETVSAWQNNIVMLQFITSEAMYFSESLSKLSLCLCARPPTHAHVYACLHNFMCTPCIVGAHRSQKRVPNPLELALQELVSCLMWVLGTEPGFLQELHEPSLHPLHEWFQSFKRLQDILFIYMFTMKASRGCWVPWDWNYKWFGLPCRCWD